MNKVTYKLRLKWLRAKNKKWHWPFVSWNKYQAERTAKELAITREADALRKNDKERDRLADLISKFTRLQLSPPDDLNSNFRLQTEIDPRIFYRVYDPGDREAMRQYARYVAYAIEREIMKIEIRYKQVDGREWRRSVEGNWQEYDNRKTTY